MQRTKVLLKFVADLLVVFVFASLVPAAHAQAGKGRDASDAQSWLAKVQSAARKLNYSGTFVYQQANQVRTSRITHVLEGRNEIEKLEVLDGKPREFIRNNEEIVCYVPEAKTLIIERRVTPDVFPAILAAGPAQLGEHYHIKKGESGRVAGRDSQSIILEPKDNLRYGYKLWADKASGLLLRAQTLDEKSGVVEQISFTQIAIGHIDRSRVKPSFPNVRGWRVEHAQMSQVNLSHWSVKSLPPGFRKIREIRRTLSDSAPLEPGATPVQREVSQMVFSDGLAAISVFIEPGSQSRTEGSLQQGAMNIVGKRQGDFWLTIVGEVPFGAIRQVANSIEFKPTKQ